MRRAQGPGVRRRQADPELIRPHGRRRGAAPEGVQVGGSYGTTRALWIDLTPVPGRESPQATRKLAPPQAAAG